MTQNDIIEIYRDKIDYYLRWYHEKPVTITEARAEELSKLQMLLSRCIEHLVLYYQEYVPKYIPLSEKEMRILEMQSRYPYHAGTYRPDFIISKNNEILLCEITSRFFGHGIFVSFFADYASNLFAQRFGKNNDNSSILEMFQYVLNLADGKEKICILKSSDRSSESKLYQPFFEYFGKKITVIDADKVEESLNEWKDSFVISALNQKDILSYSDETINTMIQAGMVNDFRTIFLTHDKRFFYLLFNDDFTDKILNDEETQFLRNHIIPTFLYGRNIEIWQDAYQNRNKYIVKHCRLGKSEKVFAGILTEEREWKQLWETNEIKDMILQPFIEQKTFHSEHGNISYDDYICGMLLCIDNNYYGPGMFRASSLPVLNLGDDRKLGMLRTDDNQLMNNGHVL